MYGAVLYLRFVAALGQVQCSMLLGRTRVASLKSTTISMLEIVAVVVGTELESFVLKKLDFDFNTVTYKTDCISSLLCNKRNTAR